MFLEILSSWMNLAWSKIYAELSGLGLGLKK